MQPQDPNDEEKKEKEADDYDTPFSLPDDAAGKLSSTHPSTDDQMDSDELYQEGLSPTAGVDESDTSDVISYDPDYKKKKK